MIHDDECTYECRAFCHVVVLILPIYIEWLWTTHGFVAFSALLPTFAYKNKHLWERECEQST